MKKLALVTLGLLCVAGCATQRTSAPASKAESPAARYAPSDLAGTWHLTMPAGFKTDVTLTALGQDRVRLGAKGNLAGLYRIDGDAMTVVVPHDPRMSSLRWSVKSPREIVLTSAPPVSSVGADYTGATLTR